MIQQSPLVGIYLKELKAESQRGIYSPMFTAALFTITKRWKPPRCPSIGEWVNTMWFIQTMEYHSALKRKDILSHDITR